jgi:hypothetical protein
VGSYRLDSVFLTDASAVIDVGVTSPVIIGGPSIIELFGGHPVFYTVGCIHFM